MRRLNKSVVAGGVVYPAGTAATPELDELVVSPEYWADDGQEPVAEADSPPPEDKPKPVQKTAKPRKSAASKG